MSDPMTDFEKSKIYPWKLADVIDARYFGALAPKVEVLNKMLDPQAFMLLQELLEELVDQQETEVDNAHSNGYDEGYAQGYEDGKESGSNY